MTGTLIKINGNGPGTGPIIPEPLYPLATDPLLRWEASRVPGANDAVVNSWGDSIRGLTLSGDNVNLRNPGAGAYIAYAAGVNKALTVATTIIPASFTAAIVFRATDGTFLNSSWALDGWIAGRAGNGALQVANGDGQFYAGSPIPQDVWHVAMFSLSSSTPANSRIKVDSGAPGGPGGISNAPTKLLDAITLAHYGSAAGSARLDIASLTIWSGTKSTAQMAAEYDAIVAGSPLV